MTSSRALRAHALAVVFATTLPGAAAAAPEYLRYYKTGLAAEEAGDWEQVEKTMREAIARKPEERRRWVVRRKGYFPHFYLGLARYHRRDCAGALDAFAESESQGAIVGRDEYAVLLRLQSDCQKDGTASAAGATSASATGAGVGSRSAVKENVRSGQLMVEKGADPTRKGLTAVGNFAPAGSGVGDLAGQGTKALDVAEAATDVVDVVLSPSQALEQAIDAYFAGKPQRTLQLLEGIDVSDPRARAQVHLFRAAASFRLHLLAGGSDAHLARAREAVGLFRQEDWQRDFPEELFDPRFVRFVRGGG